MIKKLHLFFYLFIQLYSYFAFTQNPLHTHDKYWFYRFRLLGNETAEQPGFIVIGDKAGESH